jgi:hypothetical protein
VICSNFRIIYSDQRHNVVEISLRPLMAGNATEFLSIRALRRQFGQQPLFFYSFSVMIKNIIFWNSRARAGNQNCRIASACHKQCCDVLTACFTTGNLCEYFILRKMLQKKYPQ